MQPKPFGIIHKFLRKARETRLFKRLSAQDVFTLIHDTNKWGDAQSRSGKGSNLERTQELRRRLPELLRSLGAESLVDVPCGDFHWMQQVELSLQSYIGADIVEQLVRENNRLYANASRSFVWLDLLQTSPPRGDVLLCRDCLVHFSFVDVARALRNLKSSAATYLMATQYPDLESNRDIVTGKHRPLNMTLAPFHWPPPATVIEEYYAGERMGHKCLGVWKLKDLP